MTLSRISFAAGAALVVAPPVFAETASIPGDFLLDIRTRFEGVDQENKRYADLVSSRILAGWQSPQVNGFTFLGEIETMVILNDGDYDSGLNGRTEFARIGDAEFTELNRFQLTWEPNEQFEITAGRQYLSFDQKRFVGSAGSRQDKKSHDALSIAFTNGDFGATYVYHDQIMGGPGNRGDFEGSNHLFRAEYAFNDLVEVTGFAYFIDLVDARANRSNVTWGGWVRGAYTFDQSDLEFEFEMMLAQQSDYGNNPADYDLYYWVTDVSVSRGPIEFAVGYDVIEGDGANNFANPLGANHGVLGWADAFSGGGRQGTLNGLEDFHVQAAVETEVAWGAVDSLEFGVRRHDFSAERGGADLGEEWDAWVEVGLPANFSLQLKHADFEGTDDAFSPSSRTKSWIILNYRY